MLADIASDDVMSFEVAFQVAFLGGSIFTLITRVQCSSAMCSCMQAQGSLGLVPFTTLITKVWLVVGVRKTVNIEIIAAATLVWTVWASKWLYTFMDPHVFLKIRA